MLSGVYQGSLLGPLSFLILMIGINRNTQNVNLVTFPDDTSMWHLLNTTHSPPTSIKCIRTNIYQGRRYNMLFNRDKFELLNFEKNTRTFHCERSQGKYYQIRISHFKVSLVGNRETIWPIHLFRSRFLRHRLLL